MFSFFRAYETSLLVDQEISSEIPYNGKYICSLFVFVTTNNREKSEQEGSQTTRLKTNLQSIPKCLEIFCWEFPFRFTFLSEIPWEFSVEWLAF